MAKSVNTNSIEKSFDIIERKAVNPVGRLGSLYDSFRDIITHQTSQKCQKQLLKSSESVQCKIINGSVDSSFNVLECIGIEPELRLSLLLNLTKRSGIAEVLNYPHRIDQYTRFLYYSWTYGKQQFLENEAWILENMAIWNALLNATHMITSISFGIHAVIVFQLPREDTITNKIDRILEKIRDQLLREEKSMLTLTCEDDALLVTDSIEQNLLQLRNLLRFAGTSLDEHIPNLLNVHFFEKLKKAYTQWFSLRSIYMNKIQQFSKLVIDARSDLEKTREINQALQDHVQRTMKKDIQELIRKISDLEIKGHLITDLWQQKFEYKNAAKYNIDKNDNIITIERKLVSNDRRKLILCSNDNLNENNPSKLKGFRRILREKQRSNLTLRLIYADFSYSSFRLQDMIILPSNEIDYSENHSKQQVFSQISGPPTPRFLPVPSESVLVPNDKTINILLLGETGVGKSTFINAFANYLTFDSFEQAESSEPIVIIPVSFVMTVGDNFEERIVKFGELDRFDNENVNTLGQSITQHCKSYTFDLKRNEDDNRRKVRIIDTPGFGDTRGLDQDDQNMEHSLQYINNVTHLNAICFLLKPNTSRLHIFFRTCLIQLFSLLGSTPSNNIIFCFTNARLTFYTPGNTASLLKTMLVSALMDNISFKKENTYCFDSEAFRYLVALQNGIPFADEEKEEYQMSWSTSVKESNGLMDYINKELTEYRIENEWQTIKHAQFEISYMIRPILETMRNTLRNIILWKNTLNQFIKLNAKPLHSRATRCLSCKGDLEQVAEFWIFSTRTHAIEKNGCLMCMCSLDQHVTIDYALSYTRLNNTFHDVQNAMVERLTALSHASVEFAHFLIHTAYSTKDDPFLNGLVEMIAEETYTCEIKISNNFNKQLCEELSKL
ncbi:unnamed protein product, partial [Rotaria sp. Silwood2]